MADQATVSRAALGFVGWRWERLLALWVLPCVGCCWRKLRCWWRWRDRGRRRGGRREGRAKGNDSAFFLVWRAGGWRTEQLRGKICWNGGAAGDGVHSGWGKTGYEGTALVRWGESMAGAEGLAPVRGRREWGEQPREELWGGEVRLVCRRKGAVWSLRVAGLWGAERGEGWWVLVNGWGRGRRKKKIWGAGGGGCSRWGRRKVKLFRVCSLCVAFPQKFQITLLLGVCWRQLFIGKMLFGSQNWSLNFFL